MDISFVGEFSHQLARKDSNIHDYLCPSKIEFRILECEDESFRRLGVTYRLSHN